MNGRMEKEIQSEQKMKVKLENYPSVLTDFYYDMKDGGKSYLTIERYVNHIINFINFLCENKKLQEDFYKKVDATIIKRYMNSIKRKTVNGEIVEVGDEIRAVKWSALNLFFSFLKENNLIDENPMDKTKRPRSKVEHDVTYLDKDEISAMINKIKTDAKPMFVNRDLCIFSIGLTTGLRINAICNINVKDINLEEKTITVIEKGRKKRKISFGDNLKEIIVAWMKDRKQYFKNVDTDALFISQFKRRISDDMVAALVKKYTKGITNKHITFHKLRASCAVALYDQTKDILLVADILGHNQIETTRRYTRASDKSKREAVEFLDNMI